MKSETMDFDLLFSGKALLHKELSNSLSMVSLHLNNLSVSLVIDHGGIATECLLEMSDQLFEVDVVRETLDDADALSDCSLLELDMHHLCLPSFFLVVSFGDNSHIVESVLNQIVLK